MIKNDYKKAKPLLFCVFIYWSLCKRKLWFALHVSYHPVFTTYSEKMYFLLSTFIRVVFFRVIHILWTTFNTTYTKRTCSGKFSAFDFQPRCFLQGRYHVINNLKDDYHNQWDFRLSTAVLSSGYSLSRDQ
jgi:hypothetical protein